MLGEVSKFLRYLPEPLSLPVARGSKQNCSLSLQSPEIAWFPHKTSSLSPAWPSPNKGFSDTIGDTDAYDRHSHYAFPKWLLPMGLLHQGTWWRLKDGPCCPRPSNRDARRSDAVSSVVRCVLDGQLGQKRMMTGNKGAVPCLSSSISKHRPTRTKTCQGRYEPFAEGFPRSCNDSKEFLSWWLPNTLDHPVVIAQCLHPCSTW